MNANVHRCNGKLKIFSRLDFRGTASWFMWTTYKCIHEHTSRKPQKRPCVYERIDVALYKVEVLQDYVENDLVLDNVQLESLKPSLFEGDGLLPLNFCLFYFTIYEDFFFRLLPPLNWKFTWYYNIKIFVSLEVKFRSIPFQGLTAQ